MGMFLNYHNISDNYVPNNLICEYPKVTTESKLAPIEASRPFEEFNVKGELIGYFWRYGETLNLEFNIDGEITVESDAIIFNSKGQEPTISTEANVGQRAYNIADCKSWTCTSISTRENVYEYQWTQDEEFTYPSSSDRKIYLSAADYLKDKHVEVALYNFRMELIHSDIFEASPTIIFHIDPEMSKTLVKGIYYCTVKVFNKDFCSTIFDENDCSLIVK